MYITANIVGILTDIVRAVSFIVSRNAEFPVGAVTKRGVRDIPREPVLRGPLRYQLIFPPMWRLLTGEPLSCRNFPQKLTFCWFYDHFTDVEFRGYSSRVVFGQSPCKCSLDNTIKVATSTIRMSG